MKNDIEKYKNDLKELLENHKRLNSQDEQFNVFTTLRKASDEVYLHSRFISSILDPKGNHGLENIPLNFFLEEIGSKFHINITGETEVIPNSKDWTERKEIDVFIGNLELKGEKCAIEKCAIIIENKIYATDGDKQLETYFETVTKEFGYEPSNIEVYYLTLDRHKPSDNSLGKTLKVEGEDHNRIKTVRCIEYKTEIVNWLTEIVNWLTEIKKSANGFLLNAIEQYIALVTKLTCDVEYNKELTEFVRKNWEDTKEIVQNKGNKYPENEYEILRNDIYHVYWHIITDFLNDLGVKLNEMLIANGYEKSYSERQMHEWVTEIVHTHKRDIPLHYLFKDKNDICWSLQADSHNGNGFFIGVDYLNNKNSKDKVFTNIPSYNEDANWRYRKYFCDEIKIDLWNCREKTKDKTKETETIETILKNKDSIIKQYVSIVKSELEKFGTKK
jgi:hypothetical protein